MKLTTWPSSRKRKNLDDNWSVYVKLAMSGNLSRSIKNLKQKSYELIISHLPTSAREN